MVRPRSTSMAVSVLLALLASFGPVSIDLYLPSLPAMVVEFDTSVSQIQLTLSIFMAGFAVGTLIHGPLSDRFGRRPVILGGCILYTVASLACLYAPSIEVLILGRFVQALGGCAGPVVARAVVRDIYTPQEGAKFMSYMAASVAIAPAIGPIIGSWLQALFGWQGNFYLFAGFGVIAVTATWALLAETNQHMRPGSLSPLSILGTFGTLLKSRRFVGYMLAISFAFGCMFSFISGASFVLIDLLKLPAHYFGMVFIGVVAGFGLGGILAGRLGPRMGGHKTILLGIAVLVLGGVSGALLSWIMQDSTEQVWAIAAVIAPMSLIFLGGALVIPNGTAQAIAPYGQMAGAASSLLGFVQMAVGSAAGALVGVTFNDSAIPMMGQIAVIALASAACYLLLVGRTEGRP